MQVPEVIIIPRSFDDGRYDGFEVFLSARKLFLQDVPQLVVLLIDQHLLQALLFEILDAHGQFGEAVVDIGLFEHVCCGH
jgi:hypothetical protein